MPKLIAQRLLFGALTLLAVSVLIFAATELLPGDVASAVLGRQATPEAAAAIRAELGLDRPAPARYADWLGGFFRGDLGRSLANREPIGPRLAERLGNTLFLAAVAALVAVPLAVGLGITAAVRRDGLLDRAASALTLAAISVPEFFVGYLLVVLLAVQVPLFPSLATVSAGMGLAERLQAVALPALTLTLVVVAHMMRMTRAAVVDLLAAPYAEMARLKGLSEARVVVRHALPNALGPIAAVVALNLAYLVAGVVVVEVVFVYPGAGQYMVDAVATRDVPVVQACAMAFAAAYIGLNLLADLLGMLGNPRLRHPR
jgi:peptide/nickel transport system permease protein